MRKHSARLLTRLRPAGVAEAEAPEMQYPQWVLDGWADPSWVASPEEQAVLDALHGDDFDRFGEEEVRP